MTGSLVYLGPQPERAAAFKLFGNLTLLGILDVLGDVGRLAAAVGIDMKDAFSLFEHFNPGQTLPQRAKRISAGQYSPPSFEMSMARKDLRLWWKRPRVAGRRWRWRRRWRSCWMRGSRAGRGSWMWRRG